MSSRAAYIEDADDNNNDDTQQLGVAIEDLPTNYDYQLAAGGIEGATAQQALDQFERKTRERNLIVPTDNEKVKERLRSLGEPVTCFGEGPAERRERLKKLLSLSGSFLYDIDIPDVQEVQEEEEFFTPGSEALLEARRWLAHYSLRNSQQRVSRLKQESQTPLSANVRHRKAISSRLKRFSLVGSQIAADRPVGIGRISPDSTTIAVGSYSGSMKLFNVADLEPIRALRGHSDRIGGISWHPSSFLNSNSETVVHLASGGGEGKIHLWSVKGDTPVSTLSGHESRLNRVEFHPSGRFLGSASMDQTWRLWDVETSTELLIQEGHSREVYSVAFQGDGALAASGGRDAIGRIWDLRSGRTIMVLDGHMKDILGLDFSPNGYQIASASADASVKIWDIRKIAAIYTIPAHQKLCSDVRFYKSTRYVTGATCLPIDGTYLVTSGHDGRVNIWSADDWAQIRSMTGSANMAMSADVSRDGRFICSTGYDRTVKLFVEEDSPIEHDRDMQEIKSEPM